MAQIRIGSKKNPDWTREELILALDLYQDHPSADQQHPKVLELSRLLNRIWGATQIRGADTLRNPNGVSMKLANFQRLDPAFTKRGRVGLTRGGSLERQIWDEFANEPKRLRTVAGAIKSAIESQPELSSGTLPADLIEVEGIEGATLTRMHHYRERDKRIVTQKKASMADADGRIRCEACNFDFFEHYGDRGLGFIEAHHVRPIGSILPGTRNRLSDLVVLCSNCHRMIHSKRPWLTLEELKILVATSRHQSDRNPKPTDIPKTLNP
jgi:5-methylcytosine-specific restriction enzyme A